MKTQFILSLFYLNRSIIIRVLGTIIFATSVLAITACSETSQLPRLSQDAVILSFGDSLTQGEGASESQSYPSILQRLSGRQVVNAGRNGELSAEGLRRLPGLLDRHNPDLLILCHGGNDIIRQRDMQQLANNLTAMINLAKERNIPVVLLGIPRLGLFLSPADVYSDVASSTGVVYIEDVISDVLGDRSLKSDTVHPNGSGYEVIAESIYSVLQEAGAL